QPQERRLAGAVPADETDRLARLDRHRHVAQRLHFAYSAAAARDDDVLEGALRLGVDAERPRNAVDDDATRGHAGTAASERRTIAPSAATNSWSSFGISIRS